MAKEIVLITGGSGTTAYACIADALKAGYRVRTTVRRESAIEQIKAAPTAREYLNDLEIVLVPDITRDDAFLEVLQGVTYVLHLASPMPNKTDSLDEEHTVEPAIRGTIGILKSALEVPSIKRIVITSSVAVVSGFKEDETYSETTVQPIPPSPYTSAGLAYFASKRRAYRATSEFLAAHNPPFTIINLMPTYIIGSSELALKSTDLVSGSNFLALASILGHSIPEPVVGTSVHGADVARVHIEALTNEKIKGHEDFVLTGSGRDGIEWADALKIAKSHFPDAFEERILLSDKRDNYVQTAKRRLDGSKAERVFGITMRGFEDQVVSLVGQYVALAKREQSRKD